jgi:hypothetical protein
MTAASKTETKVTVEFPLFHGKPFSGTYPDATTIIEIRNAAMDYFGVDEDPGSRYYLTHGPAGEELADDRVIGEIGDHAHAVKLTLVKELIQG